MGHGHHQVLHLSPVASMFTVSLLLVVPLNQSAESEQRVGDVVSWLTGLSSMQSGRGGSRYLFTLHGGIQEKKLQENKVPFPVEGRGSGKT